MRKAMTRGVLTVLAVLFLASKASAAPVAIGWVQWLELDPTLGVFSIVSQTGTNYLGDPAFPVVTQLTSVDLDLDVDPDGSATLFGLGDGLSFDSDLYFAPFPIGASLTGTVQQLQAMIDLDGVGPGVAALYDILDGGAITNISGGLIVLGGQALRDGETQIMYINVAPANIPEPATMFLLGSGAVGLIARRRRAARKA